MSAPTVNPEKLKRLAELVTELSVVRGKVTLSSGKEADYYVDLRRATLHRESAKLIGELLHRLVEALDQAGALDVGRRRRGNGEADVGR